MTDLTKDEVVKMAREAGFSQDWQFAVPPATLSNFATICRADLVAEVERLKKMSVANIMVRIVPGYDGGGEEIYAKSVEEVNAVMSDLSQRLDDVETDRDDWKARAEAAEAELALVRAVEPVPKDWRDAVQEFVTRFEEVAFQRECREIDRADARSES